MREQLCLKIPWKTVLWLFQIHYERSENPKKYVAFSHWLWKSIIYLYSLIGLKRISFPLWNASKIPLSNLFISALAIYWIIDDVMFLFRNEGTVLLIFCEILILTFLQSKICIIETGAILDSITSSKDIMVGLLLV